MTINIGTPDRLVRLAAGLLLLAAPFITGWALFSNPPWTWLSVLVGLVLAVTGVVRFCPLYALFKLSTARSNTND